MHETTSGTMKVRIISPSGAVDPQRIDDVSDVMRSWGWQVSEGQYARCRCGRFAATQDERLADLTEALQSDADVVLCSRGGYGLQQIIDRLPAPLASDRMPLVVGFSDITVLHQWCAINGRASLHGMMCRVNAENEQREDVLLWKRAIEGESIEYRLPSHALNRPGMAEGRLAGGNLSVLYGLQATPWSPGALIDKAEEPVILFIEDICERHYHIDRMMRNLRMSGVLARISGLIVGQMTDCEDDEGMGESVQETIADAVSGYAYPVCFGFPAGHDEMNFPLPLNTPLRMQIDENGLYLRFKGR